MVINQQSKMYALLSCELYHLIKRNKTNLRREQSCYYFFIPHIYLFIHFFHNFDFLPLIVQRKIM